jgi:hypothetical protein
MSNAVQHASYTLLCCSWRTNFRYWLFRLLDLKIRLMTGVPGENGMLTPLKHLFPPLFYPHSLMYFPIGLTELILVHYTNHSYINKRRNRFSQYGSTLPKGYAFKNFYRQIDDKERMITKGYELKIIICHAIFFFFFNIENNKTIF